MPGASSEMNDFLQRVVQTFDQPFQEVLSLAGNTPHVPRRDSGKDDQDDGDNPTHDHRIGNEAAPMLDFDGGLRQAVFRFRGKHVAAWQHGHQPQPSLERSFHQSVLLSHELPTFDRFLIIIRVWPSVRRCWINEEGPPVSTGLT